MNRTVANVLRALTVVVFLAVAFFAFRLFTPSEPQTIDEPKAGEIDVANAVNGFEDRPVTIRGHVFIGPGGLGLRLCQGRQNTSPPQCLGPFVDLDGVNEGSFSFETAKTKDGEVKFGEDPIALRGTVNGTRFNVSEILQ